MGVVLAEFHDDLETSRVVGGSSAKYPFVVRIYNFKNIYLRHLIILISLWDCVRFYSNGATTVTSVPDLW